MFSTGIVLHKSVGVLWLHLFSIYITILTNWDVKDTSILELIKFLYHIGIISFNDDGSTIH